MPTLKKSKTVSSRPSGARPTSSTRTTSQYKKPKPPQEFPIALSMLRQIYDSMIESRLWAQSKGFLPTISEATAVPAALAVKATDVFAAPPDGRTLYPITHEQTEIMAYDPARLRNSLAQRHRRHRHIIALAVLSEFDYDSAATKSFVADAHQNLWPIVFLVLTDRAFDPAAPVIEIDVDGHDAVAVFRVISESIRRARNGRGPAIIHAHGSTTPLSSNSHGDPLARFQAYLNAKGLSTEKLHVLHQE